MFEAGVGKMLAIFPLTNKHLQLAPAADIRNKMDFTPDQICTAARECGMYQEPGDIDKLHEEWLALQLDDLQAPQNPAEFWSSRTETIYPMLTPFMRAMLSIPHSNASSERVFSMLRKVFTENRSELSHETIESLLRVKLNIAECCNSFDINANLASSLKKATRSYNIKHMAPSQTASSSATSANSLDIIEVND